MAQRWLSQLGCGIVAMALLLSAAAASAQTALPQPVPISVVNFDYLDTSGEPGDQRAVHENRLRNFMDNIRNDLALNAKFALVPLACDPPRCLPDGTGVAALVDKARTSGARLLMFGGIHKMSTLIEWAKVEVVDVETNAVLSSRLVTFRGDTDEAWRRAESFIIANVRQDILHD